MAGKGEVRYKLVIDGKEFEDALKKLGEKALELGAEFLGIKGGIDLFTDSLEKMGEKQDSINALNLALANQAELVGNTSQELQEYADQLEATTTFSDDAVMAAEAIGARYGENEAQIRQTTKAAADFAAATKTDLAGAAELLGKAFEGNTSRLARYGIIVDETLPKQERFAQVLEQIEGRMGGAAEAAAASYTGQLKQFQNAVDEAQTSLGFFFGQLLGSDKPFGMAIDGAKRLKEFFAGDLVQALGEVRAGFNETIAWILEKYSSLAGIVTDHPMLAQVLGIGSTELANLKKAKADVDEFVVGLRKSAEEIRNDAAAQAAKGLTGTIDFKNAGSKPVVFDKAAVDALKKAQEEAEKYRLALVKIELENEKISGGPIKEMAAQWNNSLQNLIDGLGKFGPPLAGIDAQVDTLAAQWKAVANLEGGPTLTQLQAYRHELDGLATSQAFNTGGPFSDKTWDLLVDAGSREHQKLKDMGQTIENADGTWVRVGNEIESVKGKTDELTKATKTWHDELARAAQQIGEIGSGLSTLAGTLGSASLAMAGTITSALGTIGGDIASGNWAGAAMTAVNTIVGIFHKPEYEKAMREVGRDWGVAISEETGKAIEATENADHVSRQMAELLNLDKIMADAGGDPAQFVGKIDDLMNAVALGAVPATEGITELGKAFTDLETAAKGGSVASEAAMIGMIQRSRELGEHIPEVDAALAEMAKSAEAGLEAFLGGQNGKNKSPALAAANQQLFGAIAGSATAGMGAVDADQMMGKAFEELVKKLPKGAKLTGDTAEFAHMHHLLKDKDFAGAATGSKGLADITKALLDSGTLSQASVHSLGVGTDALYNQARGVKGATDKDALKAILPELTQLQHAQELGAKLTPKEVELLAKAQKDGLLPMKTLAEQSLGVEKQIAANTGRGYPGAPSAPGGAPHGTEHFAGGGFAPKAMLAVVGDSPGGEYMIPASHMEKMGGTSIGEVHMHVDGSSLDQRQLQGALASALTDILRGNRGGVTSRAQQYLAKR